MSAPPRPDYRVTHAAPSPGASGRYICPNCGARGSAKTNTPGSFLIEVVLWCCFLIPGLIYSLWRHSARSKVCATCRQPGLVPVNSPRGVELVARFQ